MTKLTQKQVDEFRRHPGTFADMVQAIYDAGEAEGKRHASARIANLEQWIEKEGGANNTCTFNVLGRVCGYCECKRGKP